MTENTNIPIPDIYFDRTLVYTSVFGITLVLARTDPLAENGLFIDAGKPVQIEGVVMPIIPQATIRTSLEHAKLISMLLKSHIKKYEKDNNVEVQLPEVIYKPLNIDKSDW